MKKDVHSDRNPVDLKSLPNVSLIIPFSPEMRKPKQFSQVLESAMEKAEHDLMTKYSEEQAIPLVKKLRNVIQNVKCSTNEKTMAIFVSPVATKVYYFTPSESHMNYMPPVLVQNID